MDILIKGLEMPSCCNSCPFLYAHYGEMGCRFVGRIKEIFSPNRPKNCPLIPVPEHGRLVDADILLADHPKTANWDYMVLECIIRNAPTVLEASTEGERTT